MLMQLPLASSESNVKSDVRWDHTGRARRVIRGQQMQCPINSGAGPPNALVPSFRSFVCFLNNHDSGPRSSRHGEGVPAGSARTRQMGRACTYAPQTGRAWTRARLPRVIGGDYRNLTAGRLRLRALLCALSIPLAGFQYCRGCWGGKKSEGVVGDAGS